MSINKYICYIYIKPESSRDSLYPNLITSIYSPTFSGKNHARFFPCLTIATTVTGDRMPPLLPVVPKVGGASSRGGSNPIPSMYPDATHGMGIFTCRHFHLNVAIFHRSCR